MTSRLDIKPTVVSAASYAISRRRPTGSAALDVDQSRQVTASETQRS